MKKFFFSLMALALCAVTFVSCGKDDDDDDNKSQISSLSATINGETFETSLAAFYSSKSKDDAGTSTISSLFGSENGGTTIAGTAKGSQLAITVKGTTTGTYNLDVASSSNATNLLIDLLSGKTVKESLSDAADRIETNAMIIYRKSGADENSTDYYFSTKCSVSLNLDFIIYGTGTFTATMTNKSGDTFTITDGKFKVFGKPVTSAK